MTMPQILYYAIFVLLVIAGIMVIILTFDVPNDNLARNTGYALIISTTINGAAYLFAEIPTKFYEAQQFYGAVAIGGFMLTGAIVFIFAFIVTPIQNFIHKLIEDFIKRVTRGNDEFYADLRLKISEKCGNHSITWGLKNLSKVKLFRLMLASWKIEREKKKRIVKKQAEEAIERGKLDKFQKRDLKRKIRFLNTIEV